MTISINKTLYNKLLRNLNNTKWLEKWNIDKDMINENLRDSNFVCIFNSILDEKDYSCEKTLTLCHNMMINLSKSIQVDDWLKYIFQYTLNKSFPEAVTVNINDKLSSACEFYLRILRFICDCQKLSDDDTWQSKYPMNFLLESEENSLEYKDEYKKFIIAFKGDFIYEMMKLSQEVFHYNTMDHVCGVHFLAIFIARQLKALNIPIDLGRVSGATAGHDIGKYGCKGTELKRVPYLHYYYTGQWFKKHKITYIRNIAINHSTWDLEFENLSLEALILIYCDFRVKNKSILNIDEMHLYSLEESFNVILTKLDNVDDEKIKRYRRVYEKLKDFEDFIMNIGINVDVNLDVIPLSSKKRVKNYSLLQGDDIVQNLKYLSIKHNVTLMYQLRDEYSLELILDSARSENNWKNLREYIRMLEEYTTYLTQTQKIQTMKFLYENLVHPEDDIRRHCAELIGALIAIYDEDYRKELPEDVKLGIPSSTSYELLDENIKVLLFPKNSFNSINKFRMGYSLSNLLSSLFSHCKKKKIPSYRKVILSYYSEANSNNIDVNLFLLETSKVIPLDPYERNLEELFEFIISMVKNKSSVIKISALETSYNILSTLKYECCVNRELINYLESPQKRSSSVVENLLNYKLSLNLRLYLISERYKKYCDSDSEKISEVFLSNLKTSTQWIKKKNQVDLLLQYALESPKDNALHTAFHFCNVLKVSAIESVRNKAGEALITIMPILSMAERNEVAIELLRALEIEGHQFTEYIATYLGKIILWLQPTELDEVIDDLIIKIKSSRPTTKSLVLKTVGISISGYSSYKQRFNESIDIYDGRLITMLGILLNSLCDYNYAVKQAAFSVIGRDIFGSPNMDAIQKEYIFKLTAKKILTLITDAKSDELLFLANCAGLKHIYRYISDYNFYFGDMKIRVPKKIAYFPGTFDPFSLSHKEIARYIRDKGFEVYLAIDEFSWSKKTLPNLLRKNIVQMSISNEFNIYIYPADFPVNISRKEDLAVLESNFPSSKVYIVAGSDVISNASAYSLPCEEGSIHHFSHIIFERTMKRKKLEAAKNITGEILWWKLPHKFTSISSTQIRNYIDENRDISSLVDTLAEEYINKNGFYQREPLDKANSESLWIKSEVKNGIDESIINELSNCFPTAKNLFVKKLKALANKHFSKIIILRDESKDNVIIAFSVFHEVLSDSLYEELHDTKLCQYIRTKSLGKMILIDGFYLTGITKYKTMEHTIITETLAFCISKDYEFAIYNSTLTELTPSSIEDVLKHCGFIVVENADNKDTYVVNMSTPVVLDMDIENVFKEPYRSNPKIIVAILEARRKLQEALAKLYPGECILCFDNDIMHQYMVRKVCVENKVPSEEVSPRSLGPYMCVPYTSFMDRNIIPNTVTKSLHTEKYFYPDMNSFRVAEFPHYLDLKNQVKTLKSFNRNIILVDNLLHKGYKIRAIDPILKKEDVKIQKIIVGILSGTGKDLMDLQNRKVDSVYFIPRLKIWFCENSLYPFIGGDALWRGVLPERNLLPSVNSILPYTYPSFIRDTDRSVIFNLSKVCIENSMAILTVIESEYHRLNQRYLNLSTMGQVFTIPRCPDRGEDMHFDLSLSPSHYLANDLEALLRYNTTMGGLEK